MADPQSNARPRAAAGAPASGVIHVRTRLAADFTVISNALAQRRGSAVTVGVAAYIASLPDGSPVSITALCRHFSEGEILISRALRELEAAGYLERRRERTPHGQVRTRTYFYDVPGGAPPPGRPTRPPKPRRPPRQRAATAAEPAPVPVAEAGLEAAPVPTEAEARTPVPLTGIARAEVPLAEADPRAVAVLTALRRVDPRLLLSGREAARLAPAVAQWLAAGVGAQQITASLTAGLPDHFRARPAAILAYRLRETPLSAPAQDPEPSTRPAVVPMRNCDGCDRGIRTAEHDLCRDCRALAATG